MYVTKLDCPFGPVAKGYRRNYGIYEMYELVLIGSPFNPLYRPRNYETKEASV